MSDEFKEFDEAPTPVLTFGAPVTEEKEVPAEPEKPEEPQLDDSTLTEEERKMVDDFSKQINLNDTAVRSRYTEKDGGFFRDCLKKRKDERPRRGWNYDLRACHGAEKL